MAAIAEEFLKKVEALKEAEDWDGAQRKLEQAVVLLKEIGAEVETAALLMMLAGWPWMLTDEDRAIAASMEALAIYRKLGNPAKAAEAMKNAAEIMGRQSQWLRLELDSNQHLTRNRTQSLAAAKRDLAINLLKSAIALHEQVDEPKGLADLHFALGSALMITAEDYEAALPPLIAAESTYRELGLIEHLAQCLYYRDAALVQVELKGEAVAILLESLALHQEVGDKHSEAGTLQYLVEAIAPFDPEAARQYGEAGLAVCEEIGDDIFRPDIESSLRDLDRNT